MMNRRHTPFDTRPRRRWWIAAAIVALVAIGIAVLFATAGFFDRDPVHVFPASGPRRQLGAVYFSGDMGLRYGMSATTTAALAQHGVEVVGVSSATLFATHRSRAEVNAIVADAVRQGLARTRSARLVMIGQSYGADILQTGLAGLPADLRGKVAGIILIVPGATVYFRADPSGLAYRGTPDSMGVATASTIDWTPITCIYGDAETDSLCPGLHQANAHVVAMPGGHFLRRDDAGLTAHVLAALGRIDPVADTKGV